MKEMTKEMQSAFISGNYASAYTIETLTEELIHLEFRKNYHPDKRNGYLLGFFSSYEDHEIPVQWRAEIINLREEYEI